MFVAMVHVGDVRMSVAQALVAVRMRVRLAWRIIGCMLMRGGSSTDAMARLCGWASKPRRTRGRSRKEPVGRDGPRNRLRGLPR